MVVINHFVKTGSVKFCDSSFFWSLSALLRALTINDSTARPAECTYMDNCVIAMDLTVFAVPTLAPCNIFLPSRLCFTSGRARRGWHARLADDERRQTVGVYIAFIRTRPSGVESRKEWNILLCNLRPPKSWTWMVACFSHRRSLMTRGSQLRDGRMQGLWRHNSSVCSSFVTLDASECSGWQTVWTFRGATLRRPLRCMVCLFQTLKVCETFQR